MKFRMITAAAVFFCLAVFLFACGRGTDDASTTEPFVPSPWSEAQVFTMPDEVETSAAKGDAADAESDAKADADTKADADAILQRIRTARAVYGMFIESRPQLDKEDKLEVESGLFAYRVTDPKLDTMKKLKAYVSGYFSEEIVQQLLNIGIFTEVGDKLYAVDAGMQPPAEGKMTVEVTEKTDTSEHYRLTIRSDTAKTYEFIYAKQANGKWVFTRFEGY